MFHDYTLALLVFALFVKVILLPLGLKQHSNQLKQAKIRPLEAAIVKKYNGKNDRASQQKKQMELYQREIEEMRRKVNMLESDRDSLEKFAREQFYFSVPGEDVFVLDK
jgi:cell division protein FtsB